MAQLNFDATQVEPDAGFDIVPAGWYNVAIDESDLKPTKDGGGTYLQIRFNILDGQYRGRKLFSRLNIRNSSTQAQEIALRQLSAIGHAVRVLHIADSQQLHGIPMKVKVKVRPASDDGQYEAQNEIIVYKDINEPVETVGSATGPGAPQQGFTPQQPQGFQQPVQQQQPQQFAPQPQQAPVQQPVQQFQQPQTQQQPWAQAPIENVAPQSDPANPFAGQQQPIQQQPVQQPVQEQPTQQQPWQQGAPQQQVQQQPLQQDPHAGAAQQAQQAPPPWANQGQPQ